MVVGKIRSQSYEVYGLTKREAEAIRGDLAAKGKAHFKKIGFQKISGPWDVSVEQLSNGSWMVRALFKAKVTRKANTWPGQPWSEFWDAIEWPCACQIDDPREFWNFIYGITFKDDGETPGANPGA